MFEFLLNSKKVLSRDRHPWIDYARGISIILVSYRHVFEGLMTGDTTPSQYPVLNYLNIFFFSFRMPLFFIVSGLFLGAALKRKGLNGYVQDRSQTILYPLLVWGIIHISLQILFAGYVNAQRVPSDYLRLLYQPRRIEQFWYLNALYFVGVLYALLTVVARFKVRHHLFLGFILFSSAGWMYSQGIDTGFLKDVFFFYLFFAAGDAISGFVLDPERANTFSSWKTILLLLPLFIAMQHLFTELNMAHDDDYFVQNQRPYLFALTAFIGGAFVICVSFFLQKKKWFPLLRIIGYHSLYIYVANLMATAATRILLKRVFQVENLYVMIFFGTLAGIFLPIFLYSIATRSGAWWLYTLKKPETSFKPHPVFAKTTAPNDPQEKASQPDKAE